MPCVLASPAEEARAMHTTIAKHLAVLEEACAL